MGKLLGLDMRKTQYIFIVILSFFVALGIMPVAAEKITITDIAGRNVEVETPVSSVILGEGRMIYILAMLDKDNPFKRVVGWRDEFPKTDPESYAAYLEKWPHIADLPRFGRMGDDSFSVEAAIALKPDVILMDIGGQIVAQEGGYEENLDKAGIPIIYVDFREKAMENTEPSLRIIGQLMGKQDVAEAFIRFRREAIKLVTERLEQEKPKKPVVFIERSAGFSEECCMSFGNENFGEMVEMAGGINIVREFSKGSPITVGEMATVSPEQVIASDPDHVIVTGGSWMALSPKGNWVGVGHGADKEQARRRLENLMQRPAYTGSRAVRDKKVHAAWHQFYVNPYQFMAIQQMAKWFHPELFVDLDLEANFAEFYERFLPIEYKSGYFVSLGDE